MKTCTFAGHREVYCADIDKLIETAIEKILQEDTSFIFYTGNMGEFDKRCSSAVRAAKRRHTDLDIKLVVVLPYMTNQINKYKTLYESLFDDILVPDELADTHYKTAIGKRNRWIVDRSDILLAYVYKDYGGAYTTMRYAERLRKKAINLATDENV